MPVTAWASISLSRLRSTTWSIGQCAISAVLAWWFASVVVDHPQPFFAPVAALVCLGVTNSYRLRRVGELAIGVTIGVGIADLLVREIGHGSWQIGLVVALAMSTAQLFGGGALVTAQAGIQGVFLVALPQTPGGSLYRWEDALIGGACALLVAALLPADPVRAVRPGAQLMIVELAGVVSDAAHALREGEAELADSCLERARATQTDVERWSEAMRAGEEISRISPLRRHRRAELLHYREALIGVDRAARNMRVAIRRIAAVLDRGQQLPPAFADLLDDLASTLHQLHDEIGRDLRAGPATAALTELAGRLDPGILGARTMSENVVVAQVRSAVVDLLGATGTPLIQARKLLPAPPFDPREPRGPEGRAG